MHERRLLLSDFIDIKEFLKQQKDKRKSFSIEELAKELKAQEDLVKKEIESNIHEFQIVYDRSGKEKYKLAKEKTSLEKVQEFLVKNRLKYYTKDEIAKHTGVAGATMNTLYERNPNMFEVNKVKANSKTKPINTYKLRIKKAGEIIGPGDFGFIKKNDFKKVDKLTSPDSIMGNRFVSIVGGVKTGKTSLGNYYIQKFCEILPEYKVVEIDFETLINYSNAESDISKTDVKDEREQGHRLTSLKLFYENLLLIIHEQISDIKMTIRYSKDRKKAAVAWVNKLKLYGYNFEGNMLQVNEPFNELKIAIGDDDKMPLPDSLSEVLQIVLELDDIKNEIAPKLELPDFKNDDLCAQDLIYQALNKFIALMMNERFNLFVFDCMGAETTTNQKNNRAFNYVQDNFLHFLRGVYNMQSHAALRYTKFLYILTAENDLSDVSVFMKTHNSCIRQHAFSKDNVKHLLETMCIEDEEFVISDLIHKSFLGQCFLTQYFVQHRSNELFDLTEQKLYSLMDDLLSETPIIHYFSRIDDLFKDFFKGDSISQVDLSNVKKKMFLMQNSLINEKGEKSLFYEILLKNLKKENADG